MLLSVCVGTGDAKSYHQSLFGEQQQQKIFANFILPIVAADAHFEKAVPWFASFSNLSLTAVEFKINERGRLYER